MLYVDARGSRIPALGLGTWAMRGTSCRRAVEHALDVGYRHIDTARMYRNEDAVGDAIRASRVNRGEIFVVTKLWTDEVRAGRVGPSVADSLRELKLDYVDLLLIHWPNSRVPVAETLEAMRREQDAGRVRYIGVSNFSARLLAEAMRHADIVCDQVEYHPYVSQDELLEAARQANVAVVAYCPIARGRVLRDPVIRRIAEAYGKDPAQVTLRWIVQQPLVATIPKSERLDRIGSNFDIFDFQLSADEVDEISALARGQLLVGPDFSRDR